uniref:Uncharacterized protein n=1 Tax=Timema cristinae TaxID=61476 RepID=A0A7R9CJA4_TIMCR|nr:unnamed protein product [Timema cristinae]
MFHDLYVKKDSMFSKGQCETDSYRFLAKNGGYVWVLTQATLLYGNRGQKPNSVVCVNFVTSGTSSVDGVAHEASNLPPAPLLVLDARSCSTLGDKWSNLVTTPPSLSHSGDLWGSEGEALRNPAWSRRYISLPCAGLRSNYEK